MDDRVIRAWWAHRQGLDGNLAGAPAADVLERTGWQRALGGAGAYLPLFARAGGTRALMDDAVAALAIHELPSARGCVYVVPAAHFALALRLGQGWGEAAEIATAKKHFGLTDAELDRLCQAVLDALEAPGVSSLAPRALRDAAGAAVRDFGPEAAKRGMTSTLPLALGRLVAAGEIRRVSTGGRLDQKRSTYARWRENPLAGAALTVAEAQSALARLYFRWAGPARLAHLQWFSGLSAKLAKPAIAPLGLVPLADDDDRLLFRDDREALLAYQVPREPRIVLTSNFDNVMHLRRDLAELVDGAAHLRALHEAQGSERIGGLTDLWSQPIFDRGQLIGLWEFDEERGEVVAATFDAAPSGLGEAVAATEAYLRAGMGDARIFTLDIPARRAPRLAALRALASSVRGGR